MKTPKALDAMMDLILAHKPQPRTKQAKKRARRQRKSQRKSSR
jgi:hypothetical protein